MKRFFKKFLDQMLAIVVFVVFCLAILLLLTSCATKTKIEYRDYIPVRVGQVGYMYDKVSGQLFGNAGTGAFIVGPDVNN